MTDTVQAVDVPAARLETRRQQLVGRMRDKGVYLALVLLVAYNAVFTGNWATLDNLKLQLVLVAPIVIVALGMALAIGTGGIDLSVGAVMAISAALVGSFLNAGVPAVPAVLVVLGCGAVIGLLNGGLIAFVNVQPIVATLAVLVGGRGLAQLIATNQSLSVGDETFLRLGDASVLGLRLPVYAALVPAVVVTLVVLRTTFGRRVVAIGDNPVASYLSGLPVRRTLLTVYVVSAVLAAWAGLVVTAYTTSSDPRTNGLLYELYAITAVVVGGTPLQGGRVRIPGTIAGALVMQTIVSTLNFHNIPDSVSRMVTAAIIVVAVYVQRPRSSG